MELKQYQIVLVNLDPTIGSEMKKTRPCVVISPDEMNRYLQTVVIAPMTSSSKSYPTRVEVKHNSKKGWIVLDQIRTVDRNRIVKVFDNLSPKEIISLKDVCHKIAKIENIELNIQYSNDEINYSIADIEKIKSVLPGFNYTSIDDGLMSMSQRLVTCAE